MKKTKKMLSFVLSMLLIVTMFPTMAFAKEEAKTWKFGELLLKAGDVLGKDTEIKNDAENREIRILSEKTNPDEKKDQKDDKERIKTEKEAVIAAAASWNLKDLTEKAKKAPADYLLKKADSWNGSWIVTKIAETETKDAIEIQIRTYEYAAVTEIQGIPKEIPGTTALTGKAVPENADQKQITWEITDAGMTGAVLDGTNLKVTNAGTVNLLATIKDGKKTGVDFTQEFTVIVKAADYTKVTEALALIPEDMGRYTEESAAAVQKAKDAVKENLPSAEQEAVNGYAAAIQTAVNALTLLGADYTEVDAVLAKVPGDLSIYTEESVEALNAVIASIDRTKTIEEQQAVAAYAEALENAIAALVRKPVPADYQGVEELLGEIPKDLSIYTEKSVKALNAAKEAIVWDLDDSRQEEVDQFAENLKAALDGLTLKPADYSAVNAALAKVSNDLSIYTEESIQPLQTAINSVESGKTILDQAEVDGWAAAIENALAGLQVRKADYSKVEEAIKKIPADLSLYTDASVKALEDAKNSVVTERPVTEQESVDGYAKKIEAAIAGLTYKDADYSKVDAAVKKIPNDLKKYTDESVKAVNDAKAAIVRGKNITEQKTVDGYAAALEKAIAGLKQKPMTAQNLPKITKGVNQSGMQGKELSFTADFEAKDLKKVLIDQKEIDAKNYVTAGKENTQVTLKAEYTKSLAEGKHTISIVSSKGQADTVFYLKKATKSPDTGDRTQVMLWVILLGVSRCGKTPTSLYLAMQFGIRAANYPFIADDMDNLVLPASLKPLQHKLFGLTIDPERLAAIREERRENSRYASLRQCRMEVAEVEALYRKNQLPWINSTNYSVEEIATKILDIMGLSRRMY